MRTHKAILVFVVVFSCLLTGCGEGLVYLQKKPFRQLHHPGTTPSISVYGISTNRDAAGSGQNLWGKGADARYRSDMLTIGDRVWLVGGVLGSFGIGLLLLPSYTILDQKVTPGVRVSRLSDQLSGEMTVIDCSEKYSSETEFLKDMKNKQSFYAVFHTCDISNNPFNTDFSGNSYVNFSLDVLNLRLEVYSSIGKRSMRLLEYKEVFFPTRITTISGTRSIFESPEVVDDRRTKHAAKKIIEVTQI